MSGQRGDFACDAEDRRAAGNVRQNGDVEHDVAHIVGGGHANPKGRSSRRIVVEDDDALVFVAQAQFFFRTNHGVAQHAAQFGRLERHQHAAGLVAVVQCRAFFGKHDLRPVFESPLSFQIKDVRRTGHNLMRFPHTVIDVGQHEPISVGMWPHLDDLGDDDLVPIPSEFRARHADVLNVFDFESGQSQPPGQFFNRQRNLDVVFEPTDRNFHTVSLR